MLETIGLEGIGIALFVAAILMVWQARPSATGAVRRFAMSRQIEPWFPVILFTMVITAAGLVAVGMGVELGAGS